MRNMPLQLVRHVTANRQRNMKSLRMLRTGPGKTRLGWAGDRRENRQHKPCSVCCIKKRLRNPQLLNHNDTTRDFDWSKKLATTTHWITMRQQCDYLAQAWITTKSPVQANMGGRTTGRRLTMCWTTLGRAVSSNVANAKQPLLSGLY